MNIPKRVDELRKNVQGPLSLELRKARLISLKQKIQDNDELIARALKSDLGKSAYESYLTESGFILEEIRYVLKNINGWAKDKKVKTPLNLFPARSFIRPDPYGVVLIISPWNYPFQLCMSPLIGAIAAGNRVIVKPSEIAPETSRVIKILVEEVFSEDEVIVVEGAVEETETLLKEKMDYIFFTGSTQVGKITMRAASEHLTPVTLELGGKSPLIIEESADLNLAAKRTVWGKFLNAGQTCVAPDYVLIPETQQDAFIERMKFYLQEFFGENPLTSPDYPRIVNEKHFDRLTRLINTEKLAIGGESSRADRFIPPTVLKNVSWTDKIMEDEIFGPILPIVPYKNLNEALQEVMQKPKPLAFYLFTNNQEVKEKVLTNMPFGGGCINDCIMHLANPNLPFGGVGASGFGSYHGKKSFDTFTHYKSILEQSTKVDIPLRYPPYAKKLNWLKFFLR